MRFRVLGPLEVADEKRRLTIGSGQRRVVLALLLAARGEVVSADRLVDVLWGTSLPTSARKSLYSHVSRLRRGLAAFPDARAPIVTEADGYRVDLQRHELDADRFEVLLALGREELDAVPELAVGRLDEAVGLWRGAAFGELATRDAVRVEAVRLDGLRATAVAFRIDARLSIGDHQAVIAELESTVDADPLAERPHGQLMLALYRSGRQVDALDVYRRLQRRLSEAVGVDPSPELMRLHQRILQQDTGLAAPHVRRAVSGVSSNRVTPPRDDGGLERADGSQDLIGRDDAVAAVVQLVASSPLVTLTGTGGVGKSSLAEAVVARAREAFADGVAVCALAGVRDPDSVPAALVDALGVQQQGDCSPEETVLASLGTRRLLLVLDNCEHLLTSVASMIDRIRGGCPHVTVLATSREYLRLPGERVWEVAPLPVPA